MISFRKTSCVHLKVIKVITSTVAAILVAGPQCSTSRYGFARSNILMEKHWDRFAEPGHWSEQSV